MLTTISVLKTRFPDVDLEDSDLTNYLEAAESFVAQFTFRPSLEQSERTQIFCTQDNHIILDQTPIITISSLKIDSVAQDISNLSYDPETGFMQLPDTTADATEKWIEVTYTGGYTTETLPKDLETAIYDLAYYLISNRGFQDIKSMRIGDMTIQRIIEEGLPPIISRILKKYRRI